MARFVSLMRLEHHMPMYGGAEPDPTDEIPIAVNADLVTRLEQRDAGETLVMFERDAVLVRGDIEDLISWLAVERASSTPEGGE